MNDPRLKIHLSIAEVTQKRLESLAALWELPLGRVVDRLAREATPRRTATEIMCDPGPQGYFATP